MGLASTFIRLLDISRNIFTAEMINVFCKQNRVYFVFLSLQLTAFFFVQIWLFLVVSAGSVKLNHSLALEDVQKRDLLNMYNSSLTISQNQSVEDIANHSVFKRSSLPCELRRLRKWNHCLGRRFTEIHCRKLSVACLSRDNIPPKCKKDYYIIFAEKRACLIVKGCTCAW